MGLTLAEKILADKTGRSGVRPGEIVEVDVDAVDINESFTAMIFPIFERFGMPLWDKDKVAFSVCHFPAYSVTAAANIRQLKEFCRKNEITAFFPHSGPSSYVLPDHGFVYPGSVLVATDSHATTDGAFASFATGVGLTEMVGVMLTGRIWFKVPKTIKFDISGELRPGVMAKDLNLKMIELIGVEGATYKAVEYAGECVRNMGMDGRLVLANMAVEMGAKVGLIASDATTEAFLRDRTDKPFRRLDADPDAEYEAVIPINASALEPLLACPHNPGNVKPISQVEPVKVDEAFIGACTGGRMEDLRQAARILKGKKVHPEVELIVIPATVEIYNQALDEGLINIFAKAGAIVEYACCGPCCGIHMGVLGPGETCISAGNRNFPGRMGSDEASIYLASPATVAASAVEGRIADPRKYL